MMNNGSSQRWLGIITVLLTLMLAALGWQVMEVRELRDRIEANYTAMNKRIGDNEQRLAGQKETLSALKDTLSALRFTLERALPRSP